MVVGNSYLLFVSIYANQLNLQAYLLQYMPVILFKNKKIALIYLYISQTSYNNKPFNTIQQNQSKTNHYENNI